MFVPDLHLLCVLRQQKAMLRTCFELAPSRTGAALIHAWRSWMRRATAWTLQALSVGCVRSKAQESARWRVWPRFRVNGVEMLVVIWCVSAARWLTSLRATGGLKGARVPRRFRELAETRVQSCSGPLGFRAVYCAQRRAASTKSHSQSQRGQQRASDRPPAQRRTVWPRSDKPAALARAEWFEPEHEMPRSFLLYRFPCAKILLFFSKTRCVQIYTCCRQ